MSTVIHRSFTERMGIQWPPEAAIKEGDGRRMRWVTWAELHERRRAWQAERLCRIRRVEEPRVVPCYVWVFHNDWVLPYGGWWCYVVTRLERIRVNNRYMQDGLAISIMQAVPLGLLPLPENFDRWMQAFAKAFPRRHPTDPREAGTVLGWLEGRQRFTTQKPIGRRDR